MNIKAPALAMCCFMLIGVAAEPADATTVMFDWTLSGPAAGLGGVPFPGSGTITATVAAGGDQVTNITGTVGGSTITGLTSFFGSDNLLFPTGTTFVDTKGIAFTTAAGQSIDVFSFFAQGTPPSGNAYGEEATNGFGVGTFALTPVSATPIPPTWTMMLLGLAGFGFLAYRQTKKGSVALAAA